jgi:hypothetical protein
MSPQVFEDHSKAVMDVAFVGDGHTIGTVSDDLTLKTWDLTESRAYDVIDGVDGDPGLAMAGTAQLFIRTARKARFEVGI